MIDLNDYFYLAKVIEHRGFAAAGRALGQPKSKLSKRIAALEARLGVRLIERNSRRFVVTDIGEAFAERARTMLAEAERAEAFAAQANAEPAGIVRLSCPVGIMAKPLERVIPVFLGRFPKIRLVVIATDRHVDLIAEKIDVVLRVRTSMPEEADLTIRKLAQARRILVASPGLVARHGPFRSPADFGDVPTLTMPPWQDHATWHLTGPNGEETAYPHSPA